MGNSFFKNSEDHCVTYMSGANRTVIDYYYIGEETILYRSKGLQGNSWREHRCQHRLALLKVHSDIVSAVDNGCVAVLVLLDLTAAFDTIDHGI